MGGDRGHYQEIRHHPPRLLRLFVGGCVFAFLSFSFFYYGRRDDHYEHHLPLSTSLPPREDPHRGLRLDSSHPSAQPLIFTKASNKPPASSSSSSSDPSPKLCPKGYQVITVDNGEPYNLYGFLCRFLEFALRHDIVPKIVGWGKKWLGPMSKLDWILEEVSQYPPDCMVLFMELDSLFQEGWEAILHKYTEELKAPKVLYAAECSCYPFMTWRDTNKCLFEYPKSPTKYRYLNSGMIMGRVQDLLPVFETIWLRAATDMEVYEQGLASATFMESRRKYGITLDYYSRISQIMFPQDNSTAGYEDFEWVGTELTPPADEGPGECSTHLQFDNGLWHNTYTKTTPSVLHFTGKTKYPENVNSFAGAYRKWRKETLGGARPYGEEVGRLMSTKIELSDGTMPSYREICPEYRDFYKFG